MKKFIICLCVVVLSGSVFAQNEDLKKIRSQQMELKKSLAKVEKRLNLNKDPELAPLKQAIQDAQKAYGDAVTAKLQADSEGAEILKQMAALDEQAKALKPVKGKKDKTDKANKGGNKKGKKGKKGKKKDAEGTQEEPQVDIFN